MRRPQFRPQKFGNSAKELAIDTGQSKPASGLESLLVEHRSDLLRFLAARSGSADGAEDLWQELWIKIKSVPSGPIANGRSYLFRMANNLVLDRARARTRQVARDGKWLSRDGTTSTEHIDPAPIADAELLKNEETALVHEAIEALPARAKRALMLYRFEGQGQAEIAAMMGISRSGVEKHLAVAMRHLRKRLSDCGYFGAAASDIGPENGNCGPPKDENHERGE